ncbi:MAG: hypothetical protein CMJ20_09215 [Phycisphaeraceae bacterium]|nr:hypothetical protein [Phycisphaeraceae bacterium]
MSLSAFGIRKPVPINLLVIAAIIAGIWSAQSLRREFFPETHPESAQVTLRYPGAIPTEIEESLVVKVESKLSDLDEVDELISTVAEGGGGIVVKFREGIGDIEEAVDEIERAIDSLTDLPDEAETIDVQELDVKIPVIRLTLFGPAEEQVLKRTSRAIRDELQTLNGMGDISIFGVRDYEIRVDVRPSALVEHGLSLLQIRNSISTWMTELPGGTVRSRDGNVSVRTKGVLERSQAIGQIILKSTPAGQVLRVSDIANVSDSFVDQDLTLHYQGQPATTLTIHKVTGQDIVNIAGMVRAYADGRSGRPYERTFKDVFFQTKRAKAYELGAQSPNPLPDDLQLQTNSDFARFVEGRLHLLVKNATYGAILVFATLLIFLNWRVAKWVAVGLFIALCGTLMLMLITDVTLNLLTMFGLIVVLGLLVDDAIVISENIQTHYESGEPPLTAAVRGAEQVTWPVVATVLTSIVAFLPLRFIRGHIGDLLGALPMVVTCALLMSLIESLLILPSHMGHSLGNRVKRRNGRLRSLMNRFERARDNLLFNHIVPSYGKLLSLMLHHRYISISTAVAVLMISIGLMVGGRVPYTFLTASDSETFIVDLRMPIGTPIDKTRQLAAMIENAAHTQPETKNVATIVGQRANIDTGANEALRSHIAQIFVELKPVEHRERESSQVISSVRQQLTGNLDDAERVLFTELSGGPTQSDITLQVRGVEEDQMVALVRRIKHELSLFRDIHDIYDDHSLGQQELSITLKPGAAALGLSTTDVAQQVRGALHGLNAHVFTSEGEDIDVRVRLAESSRRNLYEIENLWITAPNDTSMGLKASGQPVGLKSIPLNQIATIQNGLTYSTIKRINRQRAITVTADCEPGVSPEAIVTKLPLDELRREYPNIEINLGGRQQQQMDAFKSLPYGFAAALVMIYIILAWLFSSYTQPLAVMLVIPFGLIGVFWGHFFLGYDLTFLSLIGFVALSGIVVNDSLILVNYYNTRRAKGHDIRASLLQAGCRRFRPILLTTITTVLGLTPLMLEQSFQAKFLIPMAISISFGLVGATGLILLVLPCVILIMDDLKHVAHGMWFGDFQSSISSPSTPKTS